MAVGKSKGKVVSSLANQIYYLKLQNNMCAQASKDTGVGRMWMLGTSIGSVWDGDVTDLTGIKKAFDRSEILSTFNDIMDTDNPGSGADRMAMKFQSDYLAAMDRAFRTRHAGLVRCDLFAAERRQLQASGNLENTSITYTQRIIDRGQA